MSPTGTRMRRIGFLGPAGTFTEAALRTRPEAAGAECVPYPSVDAAFAAVRAGRLDACLVAIENSVEGSVTATLDSLARGDVLELVGETLLPITFVLAARPGTSWSEIGAVACHSHAWAQVRGWMAEHLPEAGFVPALSNAAAAVDLARSGAAAGTHTGAFQAAVCPRIAAERNGLAILAEDIGDNPDAVTRFVLVARPGHLPERTGADKTTVVLFQEHDRPGALLEMLEQFSSRGINMTRLESRPTGESLGRYCFSIDFEGHVSDSRVGEALVGLHRVCADVRFLGSYPRADGVGPTVKAHHEDEAYERSTAWLERLRGGLD
ncbi:prephenate dehydratase [Agilicoccus flavus]|uniref:prephenate dehydratase n=1 Tax=Agilicoccus flavus TaxID=2775968 RepID=UPI001CF6C98E|nr:prephenate dehydratase [Agilicoccus flavus]